MATDQNVETTQGNMLMMDHKMPHHMPEIFN